MSNHKLIKFVHYYHLCCGGKLAIIKDAHKSAQNSHLGQGRVPAAAKFPKLLKPLPIPSLPSILRRSRKLFLYHQTISSINAHVLIRQLISRQPIAQMPSRGVGLGGVAGPPCHRVARLCLLPWPPNVLAQPDGPLQRHPPTICRRHSNPVRQPGFGQQLRRRLLRNATRSLELAYAIMSAEHVKRGHFQKGIFE
jgi:hypothetical protein